MDVIATDATGRDLSPLSGCVLDVAFGADENRWELTCSTEGRLLEGGSYVYVEGTEYGGILDWRDVDSGSGVIRYGGRSWHGVLVSRILMPDKGQDYLVYKGEANAVLGQLIARLGLGDLFIASAEPSGIQVSGRFDRYIDAYSGIRKMLGSSGAKLLISFDGGRATLQAAPIGDYSADGPDTDRNALEIKQCMRCVNHLVCAGTGELRDRVEVHLYADKDGNVSQTQTYFGEDEITAFYDYTNADTEELIESGTEKLRDLQEADTVELTLDPAREYDIGDIVGGADPETGTYATATVAKKIAKISGGDLSTSYQIGGIASTVGRNLSGTSESAGAGRVYVAGRGISIVGLTISAEVSGEDLRSVADAAEQARQTASNASASAAQRISSISALAPIATTRKENQVTLTHECSGVEGGKYGPNMDATLIWGGDAEIPCITVTPEGHISQAEVYKLRLPSNTATPEQSGLMSALDKARLDKLAAGDGNAFLAAHPVGSLYETTTTANPAVTWGGIWEPLDVGLGGYLWERTA